MNNHGYFFRFQLQGVGMLVKPGINIGHFLGVRFEKIRINDLKMLRFNLFPVQGGTVLPEIDELCLTVEGQPGEKQEEQKLEIPVLHIRFIFFLAKLHDLVEIM